MAGERLNRAGRWMGFGWSDGYHACQSSGHDRSRALPPESYAAYVAGHQPQVAGELLVPHRCYDGAQYGNHPQDFHGGVGPFAPTVQPQDDGMHLRDEVDSLDPPSALQTGPSVMSGDRGAAPTRNAEDDQQITPIDQLPPSLKLPTSNADQQELVPPGQNADDDESAGLWPEQPYSAVIHDWIAMPISAAQPTRLPPTGHNATGDGT